MMEYIVKAKNGDRVRIEKRGKKTFVLPSDNNRVDGILVLGGGTGDRGWGNWDDRHPVNAVLAAAWRTSNGGGSWTEIVVVPEDEDWKPITAKEYRETAEIEDPLSHAKKIHAPLGVFIKNLTPHPVTIAGMVIEPSGNALRVKIARKKVGTVEMLNIVGLPAGEVDVFATTVVEADPLPPKEHGTLFLVSRQVAEYWKREDLVITDGAVRDNDGKIIGVLGLAQVY